MVQFVCDRCGKVLNKREEYKIFIIDKYDSQPGLWDELEIGCDICRSCAMEILDLWNRTNPAEMLIDKDGD